ncbi:hypothetical protein TNCV_2073151 [Trichonephila clavipes]|uniref:Uncharacterized protein n=1 Tax=Trichonephila clavipes TaxID=2585209 RepID=A0A8X6V069_TRICX|nr:hypothetical protein TNCV_2073151 [Trichonephila clavipes]
MENVRLFPLPARSTDISPIENVWSMEAERLSRHYSAITTVDKLWYSVEAVRTSVPIHAFQSLFDSMPRRISAVIIVSGGVSKYWFLRIYATNFLKM